MLITASNSSKLQKIRELSGHRWWRHVYYSDFLKGTRRIQTRASYEQDHRARQEAAAWIYELVRRLPEAQEGNPSLPGFRTWPSFIHLPTKFQTGLVKMIEDQLGYRPVFCTSPATNLKRLRGYSGPSPKVVFDLKSDDKKLIQVFLGWIRAQRAELGIVIKNGKKGQKSHNRRELPKKPDWRLVELLDHTPGQGVPLSDAQRARRRDAKACAYRFLSRIIQIFKIEPTPPIAELVGKIIVGTSLGMPPLGSTFELAKWFYKRLATKPSASEEKGFRLVDKLWVCTAEPGRVPKQKRRPCQATKALPKVRHPKGVAYPCKKK
jgi:hypothetical protein